MSDYFYSTTTTSTDGTVTTHEYEPGSSLPRRVRIKHPNGKEELIDYTPDALPPSQKGE